MKKTIILSIVIMIALGFYFYYHESWIERNEKLDQFKVEINRPIKTPKNIKIETKSEPKQSSKKIEINSPFKSDLKVVEINKKDDAQDTASKEKRIIEINKPDFKIKGILRGENNKIVTIQIANDFKRVKEGEQINGFKLTKVLKNKVIFTKKNKSFAFSLLTQR